MLKVAQGTLIYKPDAIWKISSIFHLIFSSHCSRLYLSISVSECVCVCFMYRLQKGQKVDGTYAFCVDLKFIEETHTANCCNDMDF